MKNCHKQNYINLSEIMSALYKVYVTCCVRTNWYLLHHQVRFLVLNEKRLVDNVRVKHSNT